MYKVVKATYQNGVLKPIEDLALENQQQVVVIVLTLPPETSPSLPDSERVELLKEQAATWLSKQPADAVRPPVELKQDSEQRLNEGFEKALSTIRARGDQFTPEEIAADVSEALVEAQMIRADEQDRLEAELDTLLTE